MTDIISQRAGLVSDSRLEQLNQWLQSATDQSYSDIQPASADASFRRYFRATGDTDKRTYVIMDAPPEKENCEPFIHITELIREVQVNSPKIIARDLSQGFLLLSDLGIQPYLDVLTNDKANSLYSDAIDALIKMQSIHNELPDYDDLLLFSEMSLFETWYLNKHLDVELSSEEKNALADVFALLIDNAKNQPQVFVHRDYHSRNLMFIANDNAGKNPASNPGIIDFQDAVIGPITYDLVSLFKDCYIEWPREKIELWLDEYLSKTKLDVSRKDFIQWFDFMGVQRHLKVLGIFSRLNYRDNKEQYLADLPLTLKYVTDACGMYSQLDPLKNLLEKNVLNHPAVNQLKANNQ